MNYKKTTQSLLEEFGIKINGDNSHDIKVYDERFYKRVLTQGSLGLGESYMDGWWDCEKLDEFFHKILRFQIKNKVKNWRIAFPRALYILKTTAVNLQSKTRSKDVAERHYDLGNGFYELMLDKRMQYTCAYWKNTKTLDEAQEHKIDLVCRKLKLRKGDRVLELGCGWGGFAKYAAEKYGCSVTAYNISKEQVEYARKICQGLPVEIIEDDYRNAKGVFDKIASVGLCEHVGQKNYHRLMKLAHRSLKQDGLFLLHTIGKNKSVMTTDLWMDKYIFPGGILPSIKQIGASIENLFVMEDWHNFSSDYDRTLIEWHKNFEKNWDKIKSNYDERFYRMWRYYLLSFAGAFRARECQLWQIVLSKKGAAGGYESIR